MSLRLDNVTRVVAGETHLADIALELAPGSVNMLLGPTLAGKTSLMRLMAGLDRPTRGKLFVDGRDATGVSVRQRSVAMVYQQFINYPSFTVYENIASPLRRAGMPAKEIDARVRSTAATLHIEPLLERMTSQLSGGQQQRTALARALVKDAELLLLDEPLVNLDYKLREELREELREIFRHREAIVVYATTEPSEALLMGGSTIVLDQGRVLQTGPTVDVYHRPATVRVGQIFSDPPMNLIAGTLEGPQAVLGGTVRTPAGAQTKGLADGRYRFGVRANHLTLERRQATDAVIPATVDLAEISGSETFVHFGLAGASWVAQADGVHPMELGTRVEIYFSPGNLFAFAEDGRLVAAPPRGLAARAAQ
jgi:glycerol transport system ATP-binding protein